MPKLNTFKNPLAIAMWDFSWMLRHRKGDSFEDYDKVLSGLIERGYNAVRIDAFPQLIAHDCDGELPDAYTFTKNDFGFQMWGNNFTVRNINPRSELKAFMKKCEEYGVWVG